MLNSFFFVGSVLATSVMADRTITIINSCDFALGTSVTKPDSTGFDIYSAAPQSQKQINVPNAWHSARISGKAFCDSAGSGCLDGPATLTEFNLGFDGGQSSDFYDVSLVDGFNVPVRIETNSNAAGCEAVECARDLNADCPDELKGPVGPNGKVGSCKTACSASLDPDPANSPNCCTGSFGTPQTCLNSSVTQYDYFHSNCPEAYAFAYDEKAGVLKQCVSPTPVDYTITFCPSSNSSTKPPTSNSPGNSTAISSAISPASTPMNTSVKTPVNTPVNTPASTPASIPANSSVPA